MATLLNSAQQAASQQAGSPQYTRNGASPWRDAMGRITWSPLYVNVLGIDTPDCYATPDLLANYVLADPIYGLPTIDPLLANVQGATTQGMQVILIPSGDTPTWAYNIKSNTWCLVGTSDIGNIQNAYRAAQNKSQYIIEPNTSGNNVLVENNLLSSTGITGNTVFIAQVPGYVSGPAVSGCTYIWTGQNTLVDNLMTVSVQLRDYSGNLVWWQMNVATLQQLSGSLAATNPVRCTGYVAVCIPNQQSQQVWKLGISPLTSANLPQNFAATLSNLSSLYSTPPVLIDGYTLGTGNYWVYHVTLLLWFEVDQASYAAIQRANTNASVQYTSASRIPNLWANHTNSTNSSVVTSPLSVPDLEVIITRATSSLLPTIAQTRFVTQTSGYYTDATGVYTALFSGAFPLAFQGQRSAFQGQLVWNYSTNSFCAIDSNFVIQEPILIGSTPGFRPNVVSYLFSLAQGTTVSSSNITFTGRAAIPGAGSTWVLGRNSLNGTNLQAVSNFAPSNAQNPGPPSTVGTYTMDGTKYAWAYHKQHLCWYEVDLPSYQMIIASASALTGIYPYSSSLIIPSAWMNATTVSGQQNLLGSVEVIWPRAQTGAVPDVSTLRYPGQVIATFTTGTVVQIFGPLDSRLPAFSTVPTASQGIAAWRYSTSAPIAFFVDQLIAVFDSTSLTYSMKRVDQFIQNAYTATINNLILQCGSKLASIQIAQTQCKQCVDQINQAWQTLGITPDLVTAGQGAEVAAQNILNAVTDIYNADQKAVQAVQTAATAALNTGNITSINSSLKDINILYLKIISDLAQVNTYIDNARFQYTVAIGKAPTKLEMFLAWFLQSVYAPVVAWLSPIGSSFTGGLGTLASYIPSSISTPLVNGYNVVAGFLVNGYGTVLGYAVSGWNWVVSKFSGK